MKRTLSALLLATFLAPVALLAVGGDKAVYVGGTVAGVKEKSEGKLDTTGETAALFTAKKTEPLSRGRCRVAGRHARATAGSFGLSCAQSRPRPCKSSQSASSSWSTQSLS